MSRIANDSTWKLLPPYASDLERDLLAATPFDGVLDPVVPRIKSSKLADIPDSWLPWLLLEYGLTNLQEFLEDSRELIVEGLALRRERGTPAGIKRVMGWLGYPDVEVIGAIRPGIHGYEYQIDLGKIPDDIRDVVRIVKLARIVQPARARLRRLYHGFDIPMGVHDVTKFDESVYDNYSGVWSGDVDALDGLNPPPNVWLSFPRPAGFYVESGIASVNSGTLDVDDRYNLPSTLPPNVTATGDAGFYFPSA